MSKIIVKQDGLYKDGVKLQLMTGDPEQVAAIRAYEKRAQAFIDGANPFNIYYTVEGTMSFVCLCDEYWFEKTVDADSEDDQSCFAEKKFDCPKCKRKYMTKYTYETDEVKIFLKK
jgi:hypothetical protein